MKPSCPGARAPCRRQAHGHGRLSLQPKIGFCLLRHHRSDLPVSLLSRQRLTSPFTSTSTSATYLIESPSLFPLSLFASLRCIVRIVCLYAPSLLLLFVYFLASSSFATRLS